MMESYFLKILHISETVMLKKIILIIGILCLVCAVLASCDSKRKGNEEEPVYITEIKLSEKTLSLNDNDKTSATLTATVTPEVGADEDVRWYSNDTSVVTVNQSGKVKVKGAGKAVVFCISDGGVSAKCTVTVAHEKHKEGSWIITQEAKCEDAGLKHKVCTICNTTIKFENIEATGHTEGEWTVASEPTCGTTGIRFKPCTVCESVLATETIDATGAHVSDTWITETDATCAREGLRYKQCDVCQTRFSDETIPMIAHTPAAAVEENVIGATCTKNGSYDTVIYCSVCSGELSRTAHVIDMLEHRYGEWINSGADCENGGIDTKTCADCGGTEQRDGTPLGHIIAEHAAKAPTCLSDGWDAYETCTREGCDYNTRVIIEKSYIYHAYEIVFMVFGDSDGVPMAPTHDGGGIGHLVCGACGNQVMTSFPALSSDKYTEISNDGIYATYTFTTQGFENENITIEFRICLHASSEWRTTKAATCKSEGVEKEFCLTCNRAMDTRAIPVSDQHIAGEWEESLAPTCVDNGEMVKRCTECGIILESDIMAATGIHVSDEWIVDLEAQCYAEGQRHKECDVCGAAFAQEAIPTTPHDLTVAVEAKAPTCLEDGWDAHEACAREGCNYSTAVIIEKSAEYHVRGDYTVENWVDSTCSAEGSFDEVYYCTLCEGEISRTNKVIRLKNHTYELIDSKVPTCQEGGYTHEECSVCGAVNHIDLDILPHVYEPTFDLFGTPTEDTGVEALLECINGNCGTLAGKMIFIPALSDENYTKCEVEGGIEYTITLEYGDEALPINVTFVIGA